MIAIQFFNDKDLIKFQKYFMIHYYSDNYDSTSDK